MDRTDLNQKMLAALIHRPFGNINADKDGGGYFDRTLAALVPRPCAVGIGFHSARLATVFPHLHDIPMDVIPTEVGIQYQSGTS